MGVVLVMGFWSWMVMGHGFGWVKLGMGGGGFCGGCYGCWYWGEAGLRWWLAVARRGCGLCCGLRKMERQWERETGGE